MTSTTEQLSAVETTKEFRALLKYMRAIAKAEPESVKEKCELESGLRQYASQKTIKAIVEHIDALEFAVAANREAQPVALVDRRPAASGSICWQNGGKDLPHGTELFTAPPAPAVPEEISSAIRHLKDTLVACNRFNYCADAVNLVEDACRAAMLAQPVSSGYTLPEGWIACSERMPASEGDTQTYVLAGDFKNHYWPNLPNTQVGVYGDWFNDGNPTWDDGDGNDLHLKEVTHWMPLPVAPEGGNDHDTGR